MPIPTFLPNADEETRLEALCACLQESKTLLRCAFLVFLSKVATCTDYDQVLPNDVLVTFLININFFADDTAEFALLLSTLRITNELPVARDLRHILRTIAQLIRFPITYLAQNELNRLINENIGQRNGVEHLLAVTTAYLVLVSFAVVYSRRMAMPADMLQQYRNSMQRMPISRFASDEAVPEFEEDHAIPSGGMLPSSASLDLLSSPPARIKSRIFDEEGWPMRSLRSMTSLDQFLLNERNKDTPESGSPPFSSSPAPQHPFGYSKSSRHVSFDCS